MRPTCQLDECKSTDAVSVRCSSFSFSAVLIFPDRHDILCIVGWYECLLSIKSNLSSDGRDKRLYKVIFPSNVCAS